MHKILKKSYESSHIDQAVTAVPLPGAIPLLPATETFGCWVVPLWPGSPLPSQPGHPGFLQDAHIDGELSADTQST